MSEITGRELDALIAERVMNRACGELLHYSTNIAAAWEVMGHLIESGATPQIYHSSGQWWVRLGGLNMEVGGTTAPLAICRAALEAMG